MSMTYAIITETEGIEERIDIRGQKELERFTDPRILAIYGAKAILIYKVYRDNAVILKGEGV